MTLSMKRRLTYLICLLGSGLGFVVSAAVITVTTTNNPGPNSLYQALLTARRGDEIRFNLPGPGPHYIQTPTTGYPLVTNSILINGYSQPGAAPNESPILLGNTAQIDVVLDSRAGGYTSMQFPLLGPNDDPGFDVNSQATVLGFVDAANVEVRGLSFLGVPQVGSNNGLSLSFLSFARGAAGQIDGCWLGVAPDGKTVAGAASGVVGLWYQAKDGTATVTNTVLVNNLTIGVAAQSQNAVEQFNVLAGMPVNPIQVEGDNTRIAGNYITVLPDGMHDFDMALNPNFSGQFQGAIAIGRSGNNTLIGTDGDGFNDDQERNILGGMVPTAMGGFDELINFYSLNPGTNIVIAGNYAGIAIDGKTRFTNGVPVVNGSGVAAQYRIGSNFDNLSDQQEFNLFANNYPAQVFPASSFQQSPETLSFLNQLTSSGAVSFRGNSLIDNFPFPVSPLRNAGAFLNDYYSQALLDPTQGVSPVLLTNSTVTRLQGTVPQANTEAYPAMIIDVYIADMEGMTNGMAAGIPQLPQGFVQGRTYLGSYVKNSAADLSSQPGSFVFDITRFKLAPGTSLTVTANYVAPVGVSQGPSITSITESQGQVTITWTGTATIQSASDVTGPWTDQFSGGNSYQTPVTGPAQFFRLVNASSGGPSNAPTLTSPFSNIVQVH